MKLHGFTAIASLDTKFCGVESRTESYSSTGSSASGGWLSGAWVRKNWNKKTIQFGDKVITKSVLFVCTGNTCRSVIASGLFKKMLEKEGINFWQVYSAGIAASPSFEIPSFVLSMMREEGIDISGHIPTLLNSKMLNNADLVLVMEDIHKKRILEQFPHIKNSENKIFLLKEFAQKLGDLNIADPIGQSDEIYKFCAAEIKGSLKKIIQRIKDNQK